MEWDIALNRNLAVPTTVGLRLTSEASVCDRGLPLTRGRSALVHMVGACRLSPARLGANVVRAGKSGLAWTTWRAQVLGLCLGLLATQARAQVIEMIPSGGFIVHQGPGLYVAPGTPSVPIGGLTKVPEIAAASAWGRSLRAPEARIQAAAGIAGVSPGLLSAVAWQESRYNDAARSPKGAVGMMQLMPATAAQLGVDASDPSANTTGGARYLAAMMTSFDGDLVKALASYNAGPAAVRRYNGVPPYRETRAYVAAIMERLARSALQETTP